MTGGPEPPQPEEVGDGRAALPGPVVDRIRGGIGKAALADGGDQAVWRALRSTARSALAHGWTFPEWADLISAEGPTGSTLGAQARWRGNRGRRRPEEYERQLRTAWESAERAQGKAAPPFTPPVIARRIAVVRRWVMTRAAVDVLGPNDRAVLAAAVEQAERVGTTRPALPRDYLIGRTGLKQKAVRCALHRLSTPPPAGYGLLTLADPGQAARDPRNRRAALYWLPSPGRLARPVVRPVGTRRPGLLAPNGDHGAQVCWPLTPPAEEPPRGQYSNPHSCNGGCLPDGRPVLTLTVSATDPERFAAVVHTLRRDPSLAVDTARPAANRRTAP